MSASQLMFLLGWLFMRSFVLTIFDPVASAILAALLRSSSMARW